MKAWVMRNFKAPEGDGKLKHLSNKIQLEFDCKEEQMRMPAYTTYSGRKGSGKILAYQTTPNDIWEPIPPESVGDTVFAAACDETIGAQKWELVRVEKPAPDKTTLRTYMDSTSVQRNGDNVSLWILLDKRSVDHDPKQQNVSLKIQSDYDCLQGHMRNIVREVYSANMGVGKKKLITQDLGWVPIEDGSAAYEIWTKVCI